MNSYVSLFFIGKNLVQQDPTKYPAAAAQTINFINNAPIPITQAAKNSIASVSFGQKALAVAGKIVYPLIYAGAAIRALKSDDKEKTLYTEFGGVTSMFLAEKAIGSAPVKSFIETKSTNIIKKSVEWLSTKTGFMKNLTEEAKLAKGNKIAKIGTLIASAAVFIAASLTGYSIGQKTGTAIIDEKRAKASLKESEANGIQTSKTIATA